MERVVALIPAAGRGVRMGLEMDKPYLRLGDRPVLAHTLLAFERCPEIDAVLVVVEPGRQAYCRTQVIEPYGFQKVRAVVAGGPTRQESVYRGLQTLEPDTGMVAVHDGVRPCVEPSLITALVTECRTVGAVLAAVPVKDTVKIVHDGVVRGTPDRSTVWLAQTPQTFAYRVLREAYERAQAEGYEGTDDAALVERLGYRVAVFRGSYENIKLTTPEDLAAAEEILRRRAAVE